MGLGVFKRLCLRLGRRIVSFWCAATFEFTGSAFSSLAIGRGDVTKMLFTIAFGDLRAVTVAAFCLRDAEVRLQANYVGKGHSAYFSARLDKLFIRLAKFISLLLGVRFPDESLLKRYVDGSCFSPDVTTPS